MSKLRFALLWLKSFWPTQLPVGVQEFEKWYGEITTLCRGRIPNNSSVRFAISGAVMHEGSSKGWVAKLFGQHRRPQRYFVAGVLKAASNQVCHQIFSEEKAAQVAEATRINAEANKGVVVPTATATPDIPAAFKTV